MSDPTPWTREEFEAKLRAKEAYYHINHPYHVLMAEGKLNKEQIQGWVATASTIKSRFRLKIRPFWRIAPIAKRAANGFSAYTTMTAGTTTPAVSRLGHDSASPSGFPATNCGLKARAARVRFAVDAYVNFARQASWQEAACSSLTELFAPTIHKQRLSGWPDLYPWIDQEGLAYFRKRVSQASRDVEHGLAITLDYFKTREQQERALEILQFKLDILWSMLDAMYLAYIENKPPYFNIKP